jgi:hypothetical protein
MIELHQHRKRETYGAALVGEPLGFRRNTTLARYPINYVMNDGGMGDYVNYAAATTWVAKNCPWIDGVLLLPGYLVPLMRDIHQAFPHWKVGPAEEVEKWLVEGASLVGPSIHVGGRNINPQLATVIGGHPMDVGFGYFAGMTPAPRDVALPVLDYDRKKLVLPNYVKYDKTPYAVFTTGGTTESRTVKARHINPVIEYTKSLGILPVFIGKTDHVGDGKNTVKYDDAIRFDLGLDMRNQTSVKDAACIMQHAAFTAGLDNGNLHLAALMQDSRLIFGYNITSVAHRHPRRRHGKTLNIAVPAEALSCSGCQSRWRQFHTHTFDKCFYGDVLCIDYLFGDDGKHWKKAIDEVLE